MVRSRWSQSRDLVDALEELANTADLTAAQKAGALDNVEDELFRFGRIVSSSTELRAALTNRSAPAASKSELLRSLLGGRANAATERLVTRLVTAPRGRSLESGLESLSKLAAERRDRTVAVVTSAVPLSDRQKCASATPWRSSTAAGCTSTSTSTPRSSAGCGCRSVTRSSTAPWRTGSRTRAAAWRAEHHILNRQ